MIPSIYDSFSVLILDVKYVCIQTILFLVACSMMRLFPMPSLKDFFFKLVCHLLLFTLYLYLGTNNELTFWYCFSYIHNFILILIKLQIFFQFSKRFSD